MDKPGKNSQLKTLVQHMINSLHDGILIIDDRDNVLFVNSAFSHLTGIKTGIIGKKLAEVNPNAVLSHVVNNGVPIINAKLSRGEHEYLATMTPIKNQNNKIIGGVSILRALFSAGDDPDEISGDPSNKAEYYGLAGNLRTGARYRFSDIIGHNAGLREVIDVARKAALTNSTVLIRGESGTGKELIAHAIHNEGKRKHYPFVAVNLGGLPTSLIESELFGYVEGSFTGASKGGRVGLFEAANKGTIFLDEIGDMDSKLQVSLLRVLDEGKIRRIGGSFEVKLDVRIIGATNKNLEELVVKGLFRSDLYFRLNVIPIVIPPLRERKSDIIPLAKSYLIRLNRVLDRQVELPSKYYKHFANYDWPGNVRELQNIVEFAVNLSSDGVVDINSLLSLLQKRKNQLHMKNVSTEIQNVYDEQYIQIIKALEIHGYSVEGKKKAAKELGISLSTLYNRLKKGGMY